MILNRDILNLATLAYKKVYSQKNLRIVESMAASGISSIRMLKECEGIKKIFINDLNPAAVELIKKNLDIARAYDLEKVMEFESESCIQAVFAPEREKAISDFENRKQ